MKNTKAITINIRELAVFFWLVQAQAFKHLHVIHSDNVAISDNVAMAPKRLGGIRKRVEQREPVEQKRLRGDATDKPKRESSGGIRKRVAAKTGTSTDPPDKEKTPLASVMKTKMGQGESFSEGRR